MTDHDREPGLAALDSALAGAAPALSIDEQRLALAVYRLLATGRPVEVAAAAAAAHLPAAAAERMLGSWTGVFHDDSSRVVGIWGLALAKMPHTLKVAGANVYAWCAWDPMFLALIVGPLEVSSQDPVSGETVSYRLNREGGVSNLSHPLAALSFLRPDQPWGADVMETFCNYVLLFGGAKSAASWTKAHSGTLVINFQEGLELARRHTVRTFGAALSEFGRQPSERAAEANRS